MKSIPSLRIAFTFLLLVFLSALKLNAANEVSVDRKYFSTSGLSSVYLNENKFSFMLSNANWTNHFTDRNVANSISLGIDHSKLDYSSSTTPVTVNVDVTVKKWNGTSFYTEVYPNVELSVSYNSTGDYNSNSSFYFSGAYQVVVSFNSVSNANDESIYLETKIDVERYYSYDITTVPPQDSIYRTLHTYSAGWVQASWPYVKGAEAYDFEWCYLDTVNRSAQIATLKYDFNKNVTRVRVNSNTYNFPLTYNSGILFFRYRPIYHNPTDYSVSVEGKWSTDIPALGNSNNALNMLAIGSSNYKPYLAITTRFEKNKNWTYASAFGEGGKSVNTISYADGLGRTRQNLVTNKDEKMVVASGVVFDSEGRPAVSVLPSPNARMDLGYIDDMNLPKTYTDGSVYNYTHYELDQYFDTSGTCGYNFVKMSQQGYGAASYFSDINPDKKGAQAFVPDADSVPFQITRYTPDNTGRIRESAGGFGEEFQPLSGRSVSFLYDQPGNGDLADYFVSQNHGKPDFYKRKHVTDQNGQRSTVYQNTNGQVVLSLLSGEVPDNLDALTGANTNLTRNNDLTQFNEWVDDSYISTYSRVIDPGKAYSFDYSIEIPNFRTNCGSQICFDCVYDIELSIVVQNPCVASIYDTVYSEKKRAGKFKEELANCTTDTNYALNGGSTIGVTPNISKPTTVYITKRVTLNDSAVQAYANYFLEESGCVPTVESLFNDQLSSIMDIVDNCEPDKCESLCEDEIGTFDQFLYQNASQFPMLVPTYSITVDIVGCEAILVQHATSLFPYTNPNLLTTNFAGGTYAPTWHFLTTDEWVRILIGQMSVSEAYGLWYQFYSNIDPMFTTPANYSHPDFIYWFTHFYSGSGRDIVGPYITTVSYDSVGVDLAEAQRAYDALIANCNFHCSQGITMELSRCEEFENKLISELRPGGYYGQYDPVSYDGSDVNSILSDNNIFGIDVQDTAIKYFDELGHPYAWNEGPYILTQQAFIMSFKESWARSIFTYLKKNELFPTEVQCFLDLCASEKDVFDYEAYLRSASTYDQAVKFKLSIDDSLMLLQPHNIIGAGSISYLASAAGVVFHDPLINNSQIEPLLNGYMSNVPGSNGMDIYEYVYRMARAPQTVTTVDKLGLDPCYKDKEWRLLRDLYLTKRNELVNDYLVSSCLPTMFSDVMFGYSSSADDALVQQMANPSDRQTFYDQNIAQPCESNCAILATQWIAQLDLSQMTNLADTTALKGDFITLCKESCSSSNPLGASSLPTGGEEVYIENTLVDVVPSFITISPCPSQQNVQVSSFADILDVYEACELLEQGVGMNPYLIESVTTYRNSIPYPILDDCGCDKVNTARVEYDNLKFAGQLPVGVGSPGDYFEYKYGARLFSFSEAECACNPKVPTNVLDLKIPVPEGIGCSECFTCDALLDEYTAFFEEVMGTSNYSTGNDTEDVYYELFSNYLKMNNSTIQFESGDLASYVKECHSASLGFAHSKGLSPHAQNMISLLSYLKDETSFQNSSSHALPIFHDYYRNSLYPHNFDINAVVNANITSSATQMTILLQNTSGGVVNDTIKIDNVFPSGGVSYTISDLLSFNEFWVRIGSPRANGDVHKFFLIARANDGATVTLMGTSSFPIYRKSEIVGSSPVVTICPDRYDGMEDRNPCLDMAIENALTQITNELAFNRDSIRSAFVNDYKTQCKNFDETFDMSYDANEYSATLYYYTVDGNLAQTVAPKGVSLGTPSAHNFKTQYKYNTLNQLVETSSPDGGRTRYWYNQEGQLVLSQNAEQRTIKGSGSNAYSEYSYTLYDRFGRITEVGQLKSRVLHNTPLVAGATLENLPEDLQDVIVNSVNMLADVDASLPSGSFTIWEYKGREQVTNTYFDYDLSAEIAGYFNAYSGGAPRYTLGRVSSVTIEEIPDADPTTYDYAIHFAYDIHGNVKRIINENPELEFISQNLKEVQYEYELLSGNVKEVKYQPLKEDAKYHRYTYDENNRLVSVETSSDHYVWEEDATYEYYLHGPLARVELGEQKVQGLDYVYNLQGWIKAMNSNSLIGANDPGKDGETGNAYYSTRPDLHKEIAQDVFGYVVDYYENDYEAIDPTKQTFAATHASDFSYSSGITALYNGNIAAYSPAITNTNNDVIDAYGRAFNYDQLNRLTKQQAYKSTDALSSNSWLNAAISDDYKVSIQYDANGNITSLFRNGYGATPSMDDLSYTYSSSTNQLSLVEDGVVSSSFSYDIETPGAGASYSYNNIGQLVTNSESEIDEIAWNVYGKVSSITRVAGSTKPDLEFKYDPFGNRTTKIVKPRPNGNPSTIALWKYTYYVNDASGNNMAIYESEIEDNNNEWARVTPYDNGHPCFNPTDLANSEFALFENGTNVSGWNYRSNYPTIPTFIEVIAQFLKEQGLAVIIESSTELLVSRSDGFNWNNVELKIANQDCQYFDEFDFDTEPSKKLRYELAEQAIYGSGRVGADNVGGEIASAFVSVASGNTSYSQLSSNLRRIYVSGSEVEIYLIGGYATGNNQVTLTNFKIKDLSGNVIGNLVGQLGTTLAINYVGNANSTFNTNALQVTTNLQKSSITLNALNPGLIEEGYYIEYTPSSNLQVVARKPEQVIAMDNGKHTMGKTAYQLSNYLGNVSNVISNRATFEDIAVFEEDFESYPACGSSPTMTAWLGSAALELCGGKARQNGTNTFIKRTITLTPNTEYAIEFDLGVQAGSVLFKVYEGSSTTAAYSQNAIAGANTFVFTPSSPSVTVAWESPASSGLSTYTLDNVDVTYHKGDKLAEVIQYQDYYPFGMIMPGRQGSSSTYRYSFNNMERDDEIAGSGNSLDFGARMYDSRLGRWFSLDPMRYNFPSWSPYNFSFDNPILFKDKDGEIPIIVIDEQTKTITIFQPVFVVTKGPGAVQDPADIEKLQKEFEEEIRVSHLFAISDETGEKYDIIIQFQFSDGGTFEEANEKNKEARANLGMSFHGTYSTLDGLDFERKYRELRGTEDPSSIGGVTHKEMDIYMRGNRATIREIIHEAFHLLRLKDDKEHAVGIMKYTDGYGIGPGVNMHNVQDVINRAMTEFTSIMHFDASGKMTIGDPFLSTQTFTLHDKNEPLPTSHGGSGMGGIHKSQGESINLSESSEN